MSGANLHRLGIVLCLVKQPWPSRFCLLCVLFCAPFISQHCHYLAFLLPAATNALDLPRPPSLCSPTPTHQPPPTACRSAGEEEEDADAFSDKTAQMKS